METFVLYFGKVILSSGVMFLYYQLSLKDKTFHHYNRFYLLFAILISLLLPLIRVNDFTIEVNNDVYRLLDKIQNFNTTKNIDNDHTYFRIIFSALGLGSLYFLGRFIYGIFRIQQLKQQFQKESFDGINFYHTNLSEAPFSYFKNLFWKNTIVLNSDIGKQILQHEMVHIEQKHSFDKIFIEVITSIFWFNPFFHIIKKEINLIHEYLADKKAVKQSDTKAFAQMLLASHFSGTQLPATSPFLSSNLKKRLKMLQKPKTKFGYARRIFALPVLFLVAFAYMVNAKNKEIKETNKEIAQAVSQIKKDTVKQEKIKEIPVSTKGYAKSDHQKKLDDLSKKINEKSKALNELKPGTKEFEKNVDELGELSSEIGKISVIVGERARIEGDKARVNGEKARIEGEKAMREGEKARIEGEKARVNAKIIEEKVRLEVAKIAGNDNLKNVYVYNTSLKTASKDLSNIHMNADFIKKDGKGNITINGVKNFKYDGDSDMKLYIDGKEVTKQEMDGLSPSKIENININKRVDNGKTTGDIRIETKK
ncbi:M56 family metallopeptidase [Chryseobacterium sp. ERMR1:04]|uniref:M56 family metallopeptidase n=1 Tax=Chryseobacterium sp. ERMR1:04 TaxID=1705393 RepID=UPI0006C8AB61|nr:M56 family metallopeptidase [Chryseobacterium sp. ERMR1:04]KPH14596.1 antirepressor [Chryseobacterium sp. ERMR1:04]